MKSYLLHSKSWRWHDTSVPMVEWKRVCPVTYRVRTRDELGNVSNPYWASLENQKAVLAADQTQLPGNFGRFVLEDGRTYELEWIAIENVSTHDWVDTGTQLSFCRDCDCSGVWDRTYAKYRPV